MSAAERTVELFVAGVVAVQQNDIAQSVFRNEPETLVTLISAHIEGTFAQLRDLIATGLLGSLSY